MTNAEILRAVSHGLKLNSLVIYYHIILSVFSQVCMRNIEVTTSALVLLLYHGEFLWSYNQKPP